MTSSSGLPEHIKALASSGILAAAETLRQSDAVAEPLYDPDVDAWLDSLTESNPALLSRIEDQIDLLRQEPISPAARRRQFRTRDGGFCHAITFEAQQRSWILIWAATPTEQAAIVGIQSTSIL